MIWCSIDPGMSGALIIWNGDKIISMMANLYDEDKMPSVDMIAYITGFKVKLAVIEKVGGITGQSASGSFNFGLGTGCFHGIFRALNIPVASLSPGYWTRIAHKGQLKSTPPKERSRVFIEQNYKWVLDMHPSSDGIWDAICIGAAALHGGLVK